MEKRAAASLLRAALDLHMVVYGVAATRRKISEVFSETIISSSVKAMDTSSLRESSGSWERFEGKWGDLSDDE